MSPDVSVVIPTFNRRAQLERTLVGLAAQTDLEHEVEVIVVSDGSTDGTDDWLRSGAAPLPVSACYQPNSGPAAARNHGVSAARGSLVLFLDDDVVPAPDLVSTHVHHHRSLDDDLVVVGPMRTPEDLPLSPWVKWEQRMLYKQYDAMLRGDWEATPRQFYTANASAGPPPPRVRRWLRSGVSARRGRRARLPARRCRSHLHLRPRSRRAALRRALVRLVAGQRLGLRAQRRDLRPRPRTSLAARRRSPTSSTDGTASCGA